MKVVVYFSIVALMGLASRVAAEQKPFEGQVVNPKALPVHKAQVVLYRLDNPTLRVTTITDERGAFSLSWRDLAPPQPNTLLQNFPNPFNPSTLIPFEISAGGHVRLDIFNILGQHVITLIDDARSAGLHRVRWDGTDALGRGVSAGVYIYRLRTEDWHDTRKLVMLDGASGRSSGGAMRVTQEAGAKMFGVRISGEEILPATFTWRPGSGPLMAKVESPEDILSHEVKDIKTAVNPFSGISLTSVVQVVSGR